MKLLLILAILLAACSTAPPVIPQELRECLEEDWADQTMTVKLKDKKAVDAESQAENASVR